MDINALEAEIREKLAAESGEVLDRIEGSSLEEYIGDIVRTLTFLTDDRATLSFILSNFGAKFTEEAIREFVGKYT